METSISDLNLTQGKKMQTIQGIVEGVIQTTGPTLFTVSDGSGTLILKAFEGPGVRAYASIVQGDGVQALITLKEFNNALEGEVMKLTKLDTKAAQQLKEQMIALQKKRAEVKAPEFLVKSELLEKLKPSFIKAATEIRLAVLQNRPIIIRHHNDADGYSSGYTLERAILPLIQKQHGTDKSMWQYYTRSPSMAPFYEIEDSIKDTAQSLADEAKFSEKLPLVVIADTGSSVESLLAIKQGKVHGIDFVVIDHHFFEKDVISSEVIAHINPFLVGGDGSTYSAGMLCTELARFISPVVGIEHIPAMAGMADMIDNPEVMKAYLALAEKKGYTKALLQDISAVIDFVSTKLRYMEAREYIEVVFGDPLDKQKELVKLLAPYIRDLEKKSMEIAQAAAHQEKVGDITLQTLLIEQTFSRGSYPKPGRMISMLHDVLESKQPTCVTLGIMPDGITIRASEESGFSVHDFLAYAKKNIPAAFVEGGGHHQAGSVRFVPSKQEDVLKAVKDFLKK